MNIIKKQLSAIYARSEGGDEGGGWQFFGLFLNTICSVVIGAVTALASSIIIFFGLSLFYGMYSGSIFSGIGFAWNNTVQYAYYTGIAACIGYFLVMGVGPFFFTENIKETINKYDELKKRLGFEGADELNADNFNLIANSELTQVLVIWGKKYIPDPVYTIINPEDIIESTVHVDDMMVSQATSGVGGSIAGAAVGGVLTGGTGAITGAIAGKNNKSSTEVRIRKIAINLILKRAEKPFAELVFYDTPNKESKGLKKGDWLLDHYLESANHWQAVFQNLIAARKVS